MTTYKVTRYYFNGGPDGDRVIRTGLTLDEAAEHCKDPETSSSTAISAEAELHTSLYGPWFDGMTEE